MIDLYGDSSIGDGDDMYLYAITDYQDPFCFAGICYFVVLFPEQP